MDIYFIEITSKKNDKLHLKKLQHRISRAFLKKLLSEKYGITSDIKEERGKPFLQDNSLYFSISHSENLIGIAFDRGDIGLDIEFIKSRNFDDILKYYKLKRETPISETEFYQIWTSYEAEYKSGTKKHLKNFIYGGFAGAISSKNDTIHAFYKTEIKHEQNFDTCIFNKIDKNEIEFLPLSDLRLK